MGDLLMFENSESLQPVLVALVPLFVNLAKRYASTLPKWVVPTILAPALGALTQGLAAYLTNFPVGPLLWVAPGGSEYLGV